MTNRIPKLGLLVLLLLSVQSLPLTADPGSQSVSAAPPVAAYSTAPVSGHVPLKIFFTDQSTGQIDSWEWDFGDGGTSFDQNPWHRYYTPGSYTVTLTVTGPGGTVSETKTACVVVSEAPETDLPPDPDSATDEEELLLFGFGELTVHAMSVDGNVQAFESNNSSLKDELVTNYRASLFADGDINKKMYVNGVAVVDSRIDDEYRTADPSLYRLRMSLQSTEPLWDTWRFTGEGLYDPNRQWEFGNLDTRILTQPQKPATIELFARLESDDNGYINGGSLRPSFQDAKFTLHQRSLFGGYADIYSGALGIEAVGGKLEGKTFRDGAAIGIRADGTTGPYDLANAPVTRGSEEVKIEVRDRFNETTVLTSRTLARNQDYNIDYERGRIILHQPVSSETVASDPVYIVITYDYQRTEDDDILGGRARIGSKDGALGSVSYLHRYIDDRATGAGLDEPENLVAGDLTLNLEEYGSGYVEIAGSEDPGIDNDNQALRAGWEVDPITGLALKADFQRIEDKFRSFGNADLKPTLNQERLRLEGAYKITESQSLFGSFHQIQGLEANGLNNPYPGRRDEKIYGVGFKNQPSDAFRWGLQVEQRDVENLDDRSLEDSRQQRLVVDLGGNQDSLGLLHLFNYGFHYEYITFRNQVAGGLGNSNTNQAAVTLASKRHDGTWVELTQKLRVLDDRDRNLWAEREDATFATVRIQPLPEMSSLATLEYKRYTSPLKKLSFWEDDPERVEKAVTGAVEYLPFDKFKVFGKAGRYENDITPSDPSDSSSEYSDGFILGQFTYFHTHHLSFNAESEYRRTAFKVTDKSRTKTWDLGLRVNWNKDRLNDFTAGLIRRWQLSDNPPVRELKSTSYILVVGGSASLGHRLFARASIKSVLLRDILDDEKSTGRVEIGYESPRSYRLSVGYERIENNPDDNFPDNYYRGQGLFLRLVGRF